MSAGVATAAVTIGHLRRQARDLLQDAGIVNAVRETDWLLASALADSVDCAGASVRTGSSRGPRGSGVVIACWCLPMVRNVFGLVTITLASSSMTSLPNSSKSYQ